MGFSYAKVVRNATTLGKSVTTAGSCAMKAVRRAIAIQKSATKRGRSMTSMAISVALSQIKLPRYRQYSCVSV